MASSKCSCRSRSTLKESDPDSETDPEPERTSRGPHAVKRRKYKPEDLNSTGLQCNYEQGADMGPSAHGAMEIQCDFEDDDDVQSVCSVCRCSSGFCNPKCEAAKVKIGKNRSVYCKSPRSSGIPVAVKRNSAPGLASLVTDPNSSCKCLGRCSRECEKRKLMDAVDAIRAKNAGKGQSRCADNQCRSACNANVQADMDEPPISPLADVPMDGAAPPNKAQSEASEVCIACQCDGPCNIQCLLAKQGTLLTPEDLVVSTIDSCAVCVCTGPCNPVCEEAKTLRQARPLVCDDCQCKDECSLECNQTKKGMLGKENQTEKSDPVCYCEQMCQAECDEYKITQTEPKPPPLTSCQAVACELCVCVGECNDKCISARSTADACVCNAKSRSSQDIDGRSSDSKSRSSQNVTEKRSSNAKSRSSQNVPERKSETKSRTSQNVPERKSETKSRSSQNVPERKSETKSRSSQNVPERKSETKSRSSQNIPERSSNAKSRASQNVPDTSSKAICATCICTTASCNEICKANKLGEKKRKSESPAPKVCEVCNCCGTCTEECELNKLKQRRSSKELRFSDAEETTSEAVTTEDATQVNGIIEEFNDDALLSQANEESFPLEKAKSSCDLPDDPICDVCVCTDTCQSKCAAIRKIKSASEFPPYDMVCDPCICIDKCTMPCEAKKKNATCLTEDGKPVTCKEDIADWIPCVTCQDGTPCSPECRERKAQAFCMPKPPDCGARSSQTPCRKPEAVKICNTPVQTSCAPLSNIDAQTTDEAQPVGKATSTVGGIIEEEDLKDQTRQSMDVISRPESKAPCEEGVDPSGTGEQCPCMSQGRRECGMCLRLRSYICSMFDQAPSPTDNGPGSKEADQASQEGTYCCCLGPQPQRQSQRKPEAKPRSPSQDAQSARNSQNARSTRNSQDTQSARTSPEAQSGKTSQEAEPGDHGGPCQCSKALGRKRSSYTERMQSTMGRLRTCCDDAEQAASPFIKAQSAFTLDVGNQQEAIAALLYKCKQKDQYIDALIDDVLDRSQSKQFNNLLTRLQEQNPNAPDFDSALITNALDSNSRNDPVCGIDLFGFRVLSVKRVGATCLMIKWSQPADGRVCGYDIIVNSQIKAKIASKDRVYAILDALDFATTISIEVFAVAPTGRAHPAALAYYAKY